ncbi:MAG: terpene cyclase/mutase family protein [Chloroflexi bacterium]|nr:terpene cyclase/mutase family protein [Chloroflexota bacterium]MCI0643416.1 terpene cyclase/mutase family protein [Chloroflexota bacterium]MCI0731038.1 terpene cyclase/mutase family protein [Chloroflexota bacterium]
MNKRLTFWLVGAVAAGVLAAWLLLWGTGLAAAAPMREADTGDLVFTDPQQAAQAAAAWLAQTHQNDDGGYTNFSTGANQAPSDVAGTLNALQALAAAGADTAAPLGYLEANPDAVAAYAAQNGSTAGKIILVLAAVGEDPHDFSGHNYAISLTNHLSPTGQYNVTTAFDQSLAVQGLAAAGEPVPAEAIEWLAGLQATEGELAGSWDDGFGTAGNPDSTAMAVLALLAGGRAAGDEAVTAAVAFLAQSQLPSGGWAYSGDFGENANSTALVIQALDALGEDFYSVDGPWTQGGRSPLVALLSWQSESGAFQADFGSGPFDDFFATIQAIPAVAAAPADALAELEAAAATADALAQATATPEATEPPPTETTAAPAEPGPTDAPPATNTPAATTTVAASPTAAPEPAPTGPALTGGDSPLPYVLIGLAVLLTGGLILWLYRGRR